MSNDGDPEAPARDRALQALASGQLIAGRFRLDGEKPLGQGGMGVVWLARDEKLGGRLRALKFLEGTIAGDETAVADFKEEVIRCQELTHPHIIRVHEFVEDPARCLVAVSMELAAGGSLAARQLQQPRRWFEPEELQPWVQQLCAALTYAHEEARIVHRDIKPANLLLDERGVKIADFGIAHTLAEAVTRITGVRALGTPAYMSPEQARGEPPQPSDDLYALGSTLYQLLTGKPPFRGNTGAVWAQLLDENARAPSIRARRSELQAIDAPIPAVWEETVAALLSKDPALRPASAREVAQRLASLGIFPAPVARLPRRKIAAASLAGVVVVSAGVWFGKMPQSRQRADGSPPPAQPTPRVVPPGTPAPETLRPLPPPPETSAAQLAAPQPVTAPPETARLLTPPPSTSRTNTKGDWEVRSFAGRDYVSIFNIAEFYSLTSVELLPSGEFEMKAGVRKLRGRPGSAEFFVNNLKFNLAQVILAQDGHYWISRMDLTKTVEPVMRPSKIKGAKPVDTIILDAGGSRDVKNEFGTESVFALDVVMRAKARLEKDGWKVILTRKDDSNVTVAKRLAIAETAENALFISVQFNTGTADYTGLETDILAPRGVATPPWGSETLDSHPGHAHDAENIALATAVHASMVVSSRMYDTGIHHVRTRLLNEMKLPAVIIRGGFMTNEDDAALIADPSYREQLATSIARAVANYRRAVGTSQKTQSPLPTPK